MNTLAKHLVSIATLIAFSPPACAQTTGLIDSAIDLPSTGGKPLIMNVQELHREKSHSIIKIRYVSGASVPSSMFSFAATCKIVKAVGAPHFAAVKLYELPKDVTEPVDKDSRGSVTYMKVHFESSAGALVEEDADPYGHTKRRVEVRSATECAIVEKLAPRQ
jgi:hypothetical protein